MTRVAVVVPVFNGEGFLSRCLDALLSTTCEAGIVVVDDASTDGSLAIARDLAARSAGRIQVLASKRNGGFAAAVNHGARMVLACDAPPDVLVFVNQDCIVSPGWLEPLLHTLADPSVGVAGARLLDIDGVTLQHAGARIEANGLTSHHGRGERDPSAFRQPRDCDYVCGALFAVRVQAWRRVGPFDEGYVPAYFEEVDWCLRARALGLRIAYVPASEARHVEASCSSRGSDGYLATYHRSRLRFVARRLLAHGAWRWLRAELRWLTSLRSAREIVPALRAYARMPLFLMGR